MHRHSRRARVAHYLSHAWFASILLCITLASVHQDGAVRLWQGLLWSDLGDLRALVCRRVVGDLTRNEWHELVPGLAYRSPCTG